MKTQQEKVKLKELKFDQELLEIRKINSYFVSRYRQAYRNGANMPAIITDQNYTVVSGNHRLTALNEEYPPDTEVVIEKRKYDSRAELLKDFTRENATHGNPLDGYTKKKLIAELMNNDVSEHEIAKIFNISVNRIEKIGKEFFTVRIGDNKTKQEVKHETKAKQDNKTNQESKPKTEPKTEPKTVQKPGKNDLDTSKIITLETWEEMNKIGRGIPFASKCYELVFVLNNDLIKKTDTNMEALRQLQEALDLYLDGR